MFKHKLPALIEVLGAIATNTVSAGGGKRYYLILAKSDYSPAHPYVVAHYWEGTTEWHGGHYCEELDQARVKFIELLTKDCWLEAPLVEMVNEVF